MKKFSAALLFSLLAVLLMGAAASTSLVYVDTTSRALTGNIVAGNNTTISASGNGTITATAAPLSGLTGLGTGVGTFLATPSSANLASAVTNETGTGSLVFANTPTLVTPNIGAATGTSFNLTGSGTLGTTLAVNGTTQSNDKDTGAIVTEGGLGVEKNANIGGNATVGGNVIVSTTAKGLISNTADGADSNYVVVSGGGAAAASRGAFINLYGNEHGGTGILELHAGNVSGGDVTIYTGSDALHATFSGSDRSTTLAGNLTVSGTGANNFSGGSNYTAVDTGSFTKFGSTLTSSNLQVGAQGFGAVIQAAQSGSAAYNLLAQPYGGNLLLGTTTDAGYKLYVKGSSDAQAMLDVASGSQYTSLAFANNGTGKGFAYWDNTNNTFAFGTYAASAVVKFNTGLGTTALTLDSSQNATFAGNLKLSAYGAGTLTTDSSGNVTATSDERAKNITGTFTKGLAEVVKLTPKTYTWKPETGLNTTDEVASLTAQDLIAAGIPEAVSTYRTVADLNDDGTPKLDADGKPLTKRIDATYTVSDRAVIAALVNAVKELNAKVAALEAARN